MDGHMCVSWCLGTRVFRDEGRLKVEPKGACFKEWMCRERKTAVRLPQLMTCGLKYKLLWIVGKSLFCSYS